MSVLRAGADGLCDQDHDDRRGKDDGRCEQQPDQLVSLSPRLDASTRPAPIT
jgi:hypothetical protein